MFRATIFFFIYFIAVLNTTAQDSELDIHLARLISKLKTMEETVIDMKYASIKASKKSSVEMAQDQLYISSKKMREQIECNSAAQKLLRKVRKESKPNKNSELMLELNKIEKKFKSLTKVQKELEKIIDKSARINDLVGITDVTTTIVDRSDHMLSFIKGLIKSYDQLQSLCK